jgi:hypothetical protein
MPHSRKIYQDLYISFSYVQVYHFLINVIFGINLLKHKQILNYRAPQDHMHATAVFESTIPVFYGVTPLKRITYNLLVTH